MSENEESIQNSEQFTIDPSFVSSVKSEKVSSQATLDLQDIFPSSTAYTSTKESESESDVPDSEEISSLVIKPHHSNNDIRRQALKRKMSLTSQQQIIVPLSERLRQERGQIDSGEVSSSITISSETISILPPKSLQLSETPPPSTSLKNNSIQIQDSHQDSITQENSKIQTHSTEALKAQSSATSRRKTSALSQTKTVSLSDTTSLSEHASQKNLQAILHLQMHIWQKLIKLKQSAQLLEESCQNNPPLDDKKESVPNIENKETSNASLPIDTKEPASLLKSSLKVVCGQLGLKENNESIYLAESLPPESSKSCYKKMNEVHNRLTDVEFQIATIHHIIQTVRDKHSRDLKASSAVKSEKTNILNSNDFKIFDAKKERLETLSDPPVTQYDTSLFGKVLNVYDENYYDWRQYHMNRMYHKKSDRTLALNRRPLLRPLRPPVLITSGENGNRVKKPHFVMTPSRVDQESP